MKTLTLLLILSLLSACGDFKDAPEQKPKIEVKEFLSEKKEKTKLIQTDSVYEFSGKTILDGNLTVQAKEIRLFKGTQIFLRNFTLRLEAEKFTFGNGTGFLSFPNEESLAPCSKSGASAGKLFIEGDVIEIQKGETILVNLFGQSALGPCQTEIKTDSKKFNLARPLSGGHGGYVLLPLLEREKFQIIKIKATPSKGYMLKFLKTGSTKKLSPGRPGRPLKDCYKLTDDIFCTPDEKKEWQ